MNNQESTFVIVCPHNHALTKVYTLSGVDEVEAMAQVLDEAFAGIKHQRQKRVIVWSVTDAYRQKFLKPGQDPVLRGEIFPSGLALARRLGRKSANLIAMAISAARSADPENPETNFVGKVCGLEVAYVEDVNAYNLPGYAEQFSSQQAKAREQQAAAS